MPCRINQVNKKTGVTYVYESASYWDKEKQQPRNKKICIGRLDSNGVFIASTRLAPEQAAARDPVVTASAEIIGASIILDTMTQQLSLESLLKASFPKEYRQILTMAYYLVSQGGPLSHCGTWCKSHAHPFGVPLTSQSITEILRTISIDELLQEMDTLTKVKYSGKYGHILTEITKPQREILKDLNIALPGKT